MCLYVITFLKRFWMSIEVVLKMKTKLNRNLQPLPPEFHSHQPYTLSEIGIRREVNLFICLSAVIFYSYYYFPNQWGSDEEHMLPGWSAMQPIRSPTEVPHCPFLKTPWHEFLQMRNKIVASIRTLRTNIYGLHMYVWSGDYSAWIYVITANTDWMPILSSAHYTYICIGKNEETRLFVI